MLSKLFDSSVAQNIGSVLGYVAVILFLIFFPSFSVPVVLTIGLTSTLVMLGFHYSERFKLQIAEKYKVSAFIDCFGTWLIFLVVANVLPIRSVAFDMAHMILLFTSGVSLFLYTILLGWINVVQLEILTAGDPYSCACDECDESCGCDCECEEENAEEEVEDDDDTEDSDIEVINLDDTDETKSESETEIPNTETDEKPKQQN